MIIIQSYVDFQTRYSVAVTHHKIVSGEIDIRSYWTAAAILMHYKFLINVIYACYDFSA